MGLVGVCGSTADGNCLDARSRKFHLGDFGSRDLSGDLTPCEPQMGCFCVHVYTLRDEIVCRRSVESKSLGSEGLTKRDARLTPRAREHASERWKTELT